MLNERASAALWLLLSLSSCELSPRDGHVGEQITLERAEIEQTTPRSLIVTGRDLPGADSCELRLRGTLHRPGVRASSLDQRLVCRALDRQSASVDLEESELVAEAPTRFEGRLELTMTSRSFVARGGLEHVFLRISGSPEAELEAARAAQQFRAAIGLRELELNARGLTIRELAEDGLAARAGLRRDDVLERIDGAPVESASDLSARASADIVHFSVIRQRGARTERLEFYVAASAHAQSWPLVALFLSLGALSGLLLPPFAPRVAAGAQPFGVSRAVIIAALALAVLAAQELRGAIDLTVLWVAPALLHLGALGWSFTRRSLSSSSASSHTLALAMATLAACGLALANSDENALVPWRWTLSTSPAAWLCAWVLARARSAHLELMRSDGAARSLRVSGELVVSAHALLLAWYGLDALAAASLDSASDLPGLSRVAVLFVAVVAAEYVLDLLAAVGSARWIELSGALAAPLVAVVFAYAGALEPFSSLLGQLTCGLVAARGLRSVLARFRTAPGDRDQALCPLP